jgi:TolB protein
MKAIATVCRALGFALPVLWFCASAHAELRIDVGTMDCFPPGIAVADFRSDSPQGNQLASNLSREIARKLDGAGTVAAIPREAFIEQSDRSVTRPNFADWRVINAAVLVAGTVQTQAEGSLLIDATIWDTADERKMSSVALSDGPQHLSEIAHRIADAVHRQIYGVGIPARPSSCFDLVGRRASVP